jgi:hypothetical protein
LAKKKKYPNVLKILNKINYFREFLMFLKCCGSLAIYALILALYPSSGFGWGEHGHDLIARTAVRLILNENQLKNLQPPLVMKEHYLSHLANTPDIVWRNGSKKVIAANGPTHYIGYEKFNFTAKTAALPFSLDKAQILAGKSNIKTQVGSAPWRVAQLAGLAYKALTSIKSRAKQKRSKWIDHVNSYILHSGLLAHFTGDLSQPLHTTTNYDGWKNNQGGLHRYFESDLVQKLAFGSEAKVFKKAKNCFKNYNPVSYKDRKKFESSIFQLTVGHLKESHARLSNLFKLDRKQAILSKSTQEPLRRPAKRKPANQALPHFENLLIERLAAGSCTTARIWAATWAAADQPNLSRYQSYYYKLRPAFIQPNYSE